MAEMKMPKFFSDPAEKPAEPVPMNHPRGMTAAADVIDFRKVTANERRVLAWQKSAWGYYDQVGELKFAFNLIAQVVSRVMLYAAISEDSADVPIDVGAFLSKMPAENPPLKTKEACDIADEAMRNLVTTADQSELLRLAALNMSVPGECYLYHDMKNNRWKIASIDEFVPGNPPRLQSRRTTSDTATTNIGGNGRTLDERTYAARIWRKHPRWSDEADSSMLGVLDQVEKVVLFDQVMRAISRSRLNAGIVYIPNGLTMVDETKNIDEAIAEFTKNPVENEASSTQVTPLILTGPPEHGKLLSRIDLARDIDDTLLTAATMAMDRTLAGLDIPKDIVAGLSDVKYANSVVIDDSLYKAHIEPLILLICDALTTAYLHPMLRKNGVDESLIGRMTIWYNPSQIVTRPDRSQAANEGYDRFLISADAWRRARGFSDLDAPTKDEIIHRVGLGTPVPPDLAPTLIENLNPEFFKKSRQDNAIEAGVPSDVTNILNEASGTTSTGDESLTTTANQSGGEINPNGAQPPPTPGPGPGRPDL